MYPNGSKAASAAPWMLREKFSVVSVTSMKGRTALRSASKVCPSKCFQVACSTCMHSCMAFSEYADQFQRLLCAEAACKPSVDKGLQVEEGLQWVCGKGCPINLRP